MVDDAEAIPPRRPIYFGWWIVLAGLVALAVVEFADNSFPNRFFYSTNTTNVLFGTIATFLLVTLALNLLRPFVGHLADRYGPRYLAAPALLIGGLSSIALSRLEPGWLPYAAAVLIGGGLSLTMHIVMATAVANWFSRNRGKAFALLLMGPAVALFLPALSIGLWINLLSLRDDASEAFSGRSFAGYEVLVAGIVMIGLAVPLAVLLRQRPDGSGASLEKEGSAEYPLDAEPSPQPLTTILKSRQYLLYIVALSLQASAIGAIRITTGSALDNSLTTIGARWFGDVVIATAVVVAVGLFVTGALSDRYDRRKVVAGILGAQLVCSLVLVLATDEIAVLALAIVIGGGVGALSAANLALQAELWGRRRFGLLLGIQMSAALFLSGVWVSITFIIRGFFGDLTTGIDEETAGYLLVIIGAAVPLAVALALILLMRRPRGVDGPAAGAVAA